MGKNRTSKIKGTALIDRFGSLGVGACLWHSEILPPNTVAQPEFNMKIKLKEIIMIFFIFFVGFYLKSEYTKTSFL